MTTTAHTLYPKTYIDIIEGNDALLNQVRDLSKPLTEDLVRQVVSLLIIGFPGRRPRPLHNRRGQERPTDMDLASFLFHQTMRQTVIEMPQYKTILPVQEHAGTVHIGERRFGQLLSLSSHRHYFSFGVTIMDMSIVRRTTTDEEDHLGAPRTLLITDHSGNWRSDWHGLSWQYRHNEAAFRDRYELHADKLHRKYQYFVHPNRRQSVFSRAYILLKTLLDRVHVERSWYSVDELQRHEGSSVQTGQFKHVLVPRFTMILMVPGQPDVPKKPPALPPNGVQEYRRFLVKTRQQLQFLVRLNEYAFYKYGLASDYIAPWTQYTQWQSRGDVHNRSGEVVLAPNLSLHYTLTSESLRVRE